MWTSGKTETSVKRRHQSIAHTLSYVRGGVSQHFLFFVEFLINKDKQIEWRIMCWKGTSYSVRREYVALIYVWFYVTISDLVNSYMLCYTTWNHCSKDSNHWSISRKLTFIWVYVAEQNQLKKVNHWYRKLFLLVSTRVAANDKQTWCVWGLKIWWRRSG
jgi:hypothetical protein